MIYCCRTINLRSSPWSKFKEVYGFGDECLNVNNNIGLWYGVLEIHNIVMVYFMVMYIYIPTLRGEVVPILKLL